MRVHPDRKHLLEGHTRLISVVGQIYFLPKKLQKNKEKIEKLDQLGDEREGSALRRHPKISKGGFP